MMQATAPPTTTKTATSTVTVTRTITATTTETRTVTAAKTVTAVEANIVTATATQTASSQNAEGGAAWMLAAALAILLVVAWIMRGSSRALALTLAVVTASAALWLAAEASFLKKPVTYSAGQPPEQMTCLQDGESRLAGAKQRLQTAESNVYSLEEAFRH